MSRSFGFQIVDHTAGDFDVAQKLPLPVPRSACSVVDFPQPDGPTKHHELAVRNLEIDAMQYLRAVISLGQIA